MAIKTRTELKAYLEAGDKPTQAQFEDLLDSCRLKSEEVPVKDVSFGVNALTDGATITWDTNSGLNASVTIAGNRTLAITNMQAGTFGLIKVKQDATGSRTLTLPAGSKVYNAGAGAIALSTPANTIDILTVYYDGTNYFWMVNRNFT